MNDLISRQAAIDEAKEWINAVYFEENDKRERKAIECFIGSLKNIPSAQPEIVRCKDCKYFTLNYVENVDGLPLIMAHEVCSFWGDGCKTSQEGFCSYGEKKGEDCN